MNVELDELLELPHLIDDRPTAETDELQRLVARTNELLLEVVENQRRQEEMLEAIVSRQKYN